MEKRYNAFTGYFKKKYGCRLQKIVIDAGFTCPNRDGRVGTGGCTYCNNAAFHPNYSTPDKSVLQQIEEGMEFHKGRYRNTADYLAYFQSFSNTYAPLDTLKELYDEALSHPSVRGIVVGTRPDCIDEEKLDYFQKLSEQKVVVIEYGIESCYDRTLKRINRGHDFETAARAVEATAKRGIFQGAHFIMGLPGETREDLMGMAPIINELPLNTLKFHQLQIIKGTAMEREYEQKPEDFITFSLDGYVDFFVDFLEHLRPDLYIERFAGEVPPRFVNHTPWGLIRNTELLRLLEQRLAERDTFQGKLYKKTLI